MIDKSIIGYMIERGGQMAAQTVNLSVSSFQEIANYNFSQYFIFMEALL
jgi:hypothetical protein